MIFRTSVTSDYIPPAPVQVFPPRKEEEKADSPYAGSAHGQPWTAYEDEFVLSSKNHDKGYKCIAGELGRTRDAVRSRYREMIGEGRETRRENRCIGQRRDGWLARKRRA